MKKMTGKLLAAFMALAVLTGGMPAYEAQTAAAETTDPRICIDINGNDGRKPSYSKNAENWIVAAGSSSEFKTNGVTFRLSNGGSAGSDLRSVNYKGLQESTEYGTPTLTMDGVTIQDGDNGGTIKLEISGLSAGTHSLKTWHSCVDNASASSVSVSINSKTTATGIACPTRVSDSDDAGMSYSVFEVSGGETVTVLIKPEGNGSQNNAWLNAIEIDGADPFKSVSECWPIHQEKHLEITDGLSWTAGEGAQSHDVYIGTDFASVYNADRNSSTFKGNQTGTTYALDKSYSSLNTYYWRVDEVGTNGTVKGAVYSFQTARLSFPTAEGYGRYARGGRGGQVLHVTNLNDSGEGSLRWALEENSGPRIIVFDVGGIIELQSTLWIKEDHGDVYVAGQTAPGDGITLIKHDFGGMGASDVVIRGIRVRVGDSNGESTGGMGLGSCNHSIVDHCSISWATDEGFSSRWAKNITFQRNIIAESLHDSVHYKDSDRNQTETHAFAASISGNVGSFHHNLLVHCTDRNWSLAGGVEADGQDYAGNLDISNNVVYNWLGRTTDGGIYRLNFVSNYYKMGPESRDMALLQLSDKVCPGLMKAYVYGNKMTDIKGNTKLDPSQDAWSAGRVESHQDFADTRVDAPFWEDHIALQSADDAYASVLSDVGANAQGLDQYDTRYIQEVKNGTYTYKGSKQGKKGIIDSQNDVGGYPNSSNFKHSTDGATNAANDTDRDGMPNTWEEAHGLDPNDPSDGSIVSLSADDYTNVELYLNELAGDDVAYNAVEPQDGVLIKSLMVEDTENASDWSIAYELQSGSAFFGDREVTYVSIPDFLEGAEYIITAADSKAYSANLGAFTAAADLSVYIALDKRVTNLPAWLSDWTDTGEVIVNSKDVTFTVYKRDYAEGETVTLGTNGQSTGCVNYTVIVTEQQELKLRGDVDLDGAVNAADAALLQDYLLARVTSLPDAKAADLDESGTLNGFDLAILKRLLHE